MGDTCAQWIRDDVARHCQQVFFAPQSAIMVALLPYRATATESSVDGEGAEGLRALHYYFECAGLWYQ
jgi:hypothetical protein